MKRKQFLFTLVTLAALLAVPGKANAQTPTSIERKASKVRIDTVGQVRIEPRSDKSITFTRPFEFGGPVYSGTSSFQPVSVDLNLGAAAGSTGGKFISPIMGNVLGANLTKAGNYVAGGIGYYSITGTNASTYPKGGLIGGITDGTTTANCAVCAVLDGDSEVTTARAAFAIFRLNSTPGSGFDYGLDLFRATHDGYPALGFLQSDVRFSSGATLSPLSATASVDFDAWLGNDCQTKTIAVTGAVDGNPVVAGVPDALASVADVIWSKPWVSSAGVVSLRGCKVTAGGSANPAAATVRATVLKP